MKKNRSSVIAKNNSREVNNLKKKVKDREAEIERLRSLVVKGGIAVAQLREENEELKAQLTKAVEGVADEVSADTEGI